GRGARRRHDLRGVGRDGRQARARRARRRHPPLPDPGRGREEGRGCVEPHPPDAHREEDLRLVARSPPMKAIAAYPATKSIRMIDAPEPALSSPTDVRLRIHEVGVCGTDREIARFDYGTPPDGSDYLIIGHESVGEVVEVGSAVTSLRPGDLVIPMVRRPC